MNIRWRPGLPPKLEEARKIAKEEFDAKSERAKKKAEQDYADIDIPIK